MISYVWFKVLKKLQGKAIRSSSIHSSSKVEAGSIIINTVMDKYSFCGYDCKIIDCDIGKFCSIADGVVIGVAAHPMTWVSTSPVFYEGRDSVKRKFSKFSREANKRTIVGNDVWIGERVLIKSGVHIGDGAVIGMGSIVVHDVQPYEIVAGNPAKHIRYRFSEEQMRMLISSDWFSWNEEKIENRAKYIQNVEAFFNED